MLKSKIKKIAGAAVIVWSIIGFRVASKSRNSSGIDLGHGQIY
ncbi:hypothetical protein QNN00_16915 [Bacillus velezensis]|nr:hypothetical protein [Bacillus velezensis]